jgi:hypothetical protein
MKKVSDEHSNAGTLTGTIAHVADSLVKGTAELMRSAKTEEDLRIGFEKALAPLLKEIGVKSEPKYEKSVYQGGRTDALHGQVIIEYEAPASFSSASKVAHAYDQLVDYIERESGNRKETLFLFGPKLVGVGFDGEQIFFVRYRGDAKKAKIKFDRKNFVQDGLYPFNAETARTLLAYLRALARLPLTAEHLAEKFGPKSALAPLAVSAFADILKHWQNPKVAMFFEEWKRLFGIVYGEQFTAQQAEEVKVLSELYGVGKEITFQELLFAVHTYFALLMKFIAAEIITLRETAFASSFCRELTHASPEAFKEKLADIEDGGPYARRGISNFLEGDFFRWYLEAMPPRLCDAIREVARALGEFEPATTIIEPEATRDLLKKLYQYLVPQEVRHRLGEYYTPDWLAELTLDETGYNGDARKRFLDPACGSGTFLVLAIQRAKAYAREHREPQPETAKRITANVWGFDLNPLAVIASRTNYLFALGELAEELQSFEIPIYLCDSVLNPTRTGKALFDSQHAAIVTSVRTFSVPRFWIENGFLLGKAAPMLGRLVKNGYSADEAVARMKAEGLIFGPLESAARQFYTELLNLEKEGRDGIWALFLKNAFAPTVAGATFDYVVGNPPWIRWGYLAQEYRAATLPLWQSYGLFSLRGHAARLGGGEKDFSMLFTYAAADYYLKDGGRLGFLVTQEVMKSKGAGEGFRRFRLGEDGKHLKVLKAHDLVAIQPFEGAANKTAMIVLEKGKPTTYPVPYTVWTRKRGVGRVPAHALWSEASLYLEKRKLEASPIGSPTSSWQTISKEQGGLTKLQGHNSYRARRGASTEPYGVFWLEVKQVRADGNLIVRNLADRGKRKVEQVEEVVEQDLIYPAVSGADITRWGAVPGFYLIVVQDINTRSGYAETIMKEKWPRTYGYLSRFREVLLDRAAYKKYHAESKGAFYSQYNIADYSFAPYKVVWKRMATDMVAAVISQHKTPFGYKTVIPTDTTSLIAAKSEAEAHYLCAILNVAIVREFIKSYSSAGRGFGAPSVMEHIAIPQFNKDNPTHKHLAEISAKCHELRAAGGKENEIAELEKQNEETVRQLFGTSHGS